MSVQDRLAAIMAEQGETVTYRRVTSISRNSATQTRTNGYTNYTIKAHIRKFEAKEIVGLLQMGDREVRIATNSVSFIPSRNDHIIVGSEEFNVVSVDRRTANGSNALYILHIRGAND